MRKIKNLFILFLLILFSFACKQKDNKEEQKITKKDISHAEKLINLQFNESEKDSMIDGLLNQRKSFEKIREVNLPNKTPYALHFNPVPSGEEIKITQKPIKWDMPGKHSVPKDINKLAFYSVPELAYLIKNKKITSAELTKLYLKRLKKYSDTLNCLITLTEERAMKQARKADEELSKGKYRGQLHGIPYGLKDLVSVKGYKTTWGAAPFKEQQFQENATIVEKLDKAGAVLVAKLSLGALAMGDVWFEEKTRNPWDINQGSSGSSAGSAAATTAGLVGFSIGTETYGSIVSPSTRCGASGLRPTFGRVSRYGTMALSWSMDKIGPICRSAQGCAMVVNAINGPDGKDQSVKDYPFNVNLKKDVKKLKIGYLKNLFYQDYRGRRQDSLALETIKNMGVELHPISLPDSIPVGSLLPILEAEAASAFDKLTRSGRDDELVRQTKNAWPNLFRTARFIPAVEYIRANRLRSVLMQQIHDLFKKYDVIISPSFGGYQLLTTNLTGHPCVVVPNGFDEKGHPTSISFLGNLYDEGSPLEMANAFQKATSFEDKHPEKFDGNYKPE
jgi:Asp-tRNA(Asn)/Glu-tRNA(Gln) amidotransferase A subunit family amidase